MCSSNTEWDQHYQELLVMCSIATRGSKPHMCWLLYLNWYCKNHKWTKNCCLRCISLWIREICLLHSVSAHKLRGGRHHGQGIFQLFKQISCLVLFVITIMIFLCNFHLRKWKVSVIQCSLTPRQTCHCFFPSIYYQCIILLIIVIKGDRVHSQTVFVVSLHYWATVHWVAFFHSYSSVFFSFSLI